MRFVVQQLNSMEKYMSHQTARASGSDSKHQVQAIPSVEDVMCYPTKSDPRLDTQNLREFKTQHDSYEKQLITNSMTADSSNNCSPQNHQSEFDSSVPDACVRIDG